MPTSPIAAAVLPTAAQERQTPNTFDRYRWSVAPLRATRRRLERMLDVEIERLGQDDAVALELVEERQANELAEVVRRLRARRG